MYFNEACTVCSTAALFLLLISILCRLMAGTFLKKLLEEAENMSVTQERRLRQCKLKFQNYYELNGGNMNVEIFVDKFLEGIRIGKCSLRMLKLISGQLLLAAEFLWGASACAALANGVTWGKIWPCYALALGGLYLFLAVSGLADLQGKSAKLKTTLVDFFSNRMEVRILSVKKDSAYLDSFEKAGAQEQNPGNAFMKQDVEAAPKNSLEPEAADELERLLSEFL